MNKIYGIIGKPIQWLLIAWVIVAILISPAIVCLHDNGSFNGFFCTHFGSLGFFVSLFGPVLLMPLFLSLIITHRLSKIFYPNEFNYVLISHTISILTALLAVILFIVSVATLNVPYAVVELVSNPFLKYISEILLISLWIAPAGMLYMLAIFMIQFGMLPKTLNQGFKPLLIYILSGGLAAMLFAILSMLINNLINAPIINATIDLPANTPINLAHSHGKSILQLTSFNPIVLPNSLEFIAQRPHSLLTAVLSPYISLLFDLIVPLPMILLFKYCIIDRIKIP